MKDLVIISLTALLFAAEIPAEQPGRVLDRSCILPPATFAAGTADVALTGERDPALIYTKWGALDPSGVLLLKPRDLRSDIVCPGQRVIKCGRALTEAEIGLLEKAGVGVLSYIPYNAYLVKGETALPEGFGGGSLFIPISPALKIDPSLLRTEWPVPPILNVVLARGAKLVEVLKPAGESSPGAEIISVFAGPEISMRLSCRGKDLAAFLERLALSDDVISVEPWFLPEPLNDNSIYAVQSYDTLNKTDYPVCATIWNKGLTGTGEIPAVCDTGLDSDMCFFRLSSGASAITDAQYDLVLPDPGTIDPGKKVVAYDVLPGATAYDGPCASYHGTHVCCSLAGDNYATPSTSSSGGHDNGDGMAPNARIFFQGAGATTSQCLVGLANDWQMIFQQAYNAGARIHSNSWGTDVGGAYDGDSRAVDIFSFGHEDFLLLFAGGNAGYPDNPYTLDSPATAKNVVAVGATYNGSTGANERANYSSEGPCRDGRLKPDLVAPGDSIISASGDSSHSTNNCSNKIKSGTSMATPTAAGAATLLRQYLREGYYPTGAALPGDSILPSAALMKAMLINGAVEVSASGQETMLQSLYPDDEQGWGRLLLDTALFFSSPSRESRGLRIWDKWNGSGIMTGGEDVYTVYVTSPDEPLKITVAWTEPPPSPLAGIALCHDLDLETVSPGGEIYRGNSFDQGASCPGGVKDAVNNVEEIFIPDPSTGTWTIKVRGAHIPFIPGFAGSSSQGYGLVVTFPDCGGCSLEVQSLTASDNGETGIDLGWPAVTGATWYQVYRASEGCGSGDDSFMFIGTSSANSYTDTLAEGGFTYAYRVRAADECGEGPVSPCAHAAFSGNCGLAPSFGGISQAEGSYSAGCSIDLSWNAASSNCPSNPGITYNIYRSLSPYEKPSAATLIETGVTAEAFSDSLVFPNLTYYYTVRAEDSGVSGGGPGNGGNEDTNEDVHHATAHSGSYAFATFTDGGGDGERALLRLQSPWRVTRTENRTAGGLYSYHAAQDLYPYPNAVCAAAETEDIALEPSSSPVLSYYVNYNIENGYDGCVVEISGDGGDSWISLTPDGGYPGSFSLTGSPPFNKCGYESTRGAFSGPTGNSALSGWTLYSHDLSAYAGYTIRIRWAFSSDGGTAFDGIYLDDITITHASNYLDCTGSDGSVALGGARISCSGTLSVELYDSDLAGAGSASVTVKSGTDPAGETVMLTESPASPGKFEGTAQATADPAAADGMISLSPDDLLTAEYTDADDGSGGINVLKTASAMAVCDPPGEVAAGFSPYDVQSFWPDKATQVWPEEQIAEYYRLYRGGLSDLPALAGSGGGTCLYEGFLPKFPCPESPATVPGRMYWYLVTAVNAAGEGTAGSSSAGERLTGAASCP